MTAMAPITSQAPFDTQALPCGLLTMDEQGTVLAANAELARLLHVPPEALPGRAFEDLLTAGARVYHHMVLAPMLRLDGQVEEVSLILRASDGADVHVLFNARRRITAQGAVNDCVLLHVRQRKELQDKLLQAHRTAEQMPGVLFRLVSEPDGRWRLPYASKGLQDLTGLDAALLFDDASPLLEAVHPADRARVMASLLRGRARRTSRPLNVRLLGPGRRLVWVRAHTRVQAQGDCVVWQGALYDVTQQQQIDERLRDLDKLQAVATLAAGVAHDFNNLLGSITGLAELCQLEAPAQSRQMRNLQRVVAAAHKASALVRQLLDFSRQSPPQMETLTLAELLRRTSALLVASLPPDVRLRVLVDADAWVRVDPVQMEQCLLNLVNNAAHALRRQGGEVQVVGDVACPAVTGSSSSPGMQRRARLRVIDHGEGIPPELLKKIFEPFFTTKPVGEGTGLGLSAVHGVVTGHGGSVTVESTPGEGTVFTLWLPLADPRECLPSPSSSDFCETTL